MTAILGRVAATTVVAAFLFVAGWGAWQSVELARLRDRERISVLHTDSVDAARDSTRAVSLSGLRSVLTDSVRVYQRRIVQTAQVADSLDRALRQERAARYFATVTIGALRAELHSRVVDAGDSVRRGDFALRLPPYSIVASVTLPPAPSDGEMTAAITLDTAVFEARVGCGPLGGSGVRPATLSLTGPRWVTVRLENLEQDPRVCSPLQEPKRLSAWWVGRVVSSLSLTLGVGAVVGRDGRVSAGPAAVVGFRINRQE